MSEIWSDSAGLGAVRLPTAAVVVVALLGAAQLALFIWALIDLLRRARPSLLPRWAWLAIIIVFELLGPIFYLALGRGESPAADEALLRREPGGAAELDRSRAQRAVDMLYGPSSAVAERGEADPPAAARDQASRPAVPQSDADPPAAPDDPPGRGPAGCA